MVYRIPIEMVAVDEHGVHPLIQAHLGHEELPVYLLIDTGASRSVFDKNIAGNIFETTRTEEGNFSSGINAQPIDISSGHLSKLKIGGFSLRKIWVPIMDLSAINRIYLEQTQKEFGGLIGSDFLLKHRTSIDFRRKELIIRDYRRKPRLPSL